MGLFGECKLGGLIYSSAGPKDSRHGFSRKRQGARVVEILFIGEEKKPNEGIPIFLVMYIHTPFGIVFFFLLISLFSKGETSKMAWECCFHLKEIPIELSRGSGVMTENNCGLNFQLFLGGGFFLWCFFCIVHSAAPPSKRLTNTILLSRNIALEKKAG